MAEDSSLRDLILGYCQIVGGLIEPPAFSIHEVLLPDEISTRWEVNSFQRFSFTAQNSSLPMREGEVTSLYYGHPLVETIISELRQRPANTRFFINSPRLEKPGLRELIEKTLTFANARSTVGQTQHTRLFHYVCFNFKVNLVSDEKRELIVQVTMHLQGGYRVQWREMLTQAILEPENAYPHLDDAPLVGRAFQPKENLLSAENLASLLERARLAVLDEIAPTLETHQKRSQHFLDLDRARLEDYYTDLQHDLEKRLAKSDADHRPALEAKLTALQTERQSKRTDAEQKYRLRLDLELINLAIITQPKLELDIEITKRGVTTKRGAVWNPVQHILEPLVCDACGQPGEGLHLCESGHLAHTACLAPQCRDCKRTFCTLCAEKVHTCVVCDGSVCIHSLLSCKTCGRETCQKHANLCHAADGQPQRTPVTTQAAEPPKPEAVQPSKTTAQTSGKSKTPTPKKKVKLDNHPKTATAQRIQVEVETGSTEVRAFALHRERKIAMRVWELVDEGIQITCRCEKSWDCPVNGMIYRPVEAEQIEKKIMDLIRSFALEYRVPERKVSFLRLTTGGVLEIRLLKLPPVWKDPLRLAAAQAAFDKLPRR